MSELNPKKLAKAFGMTVTNLSAFCGYSRQGLYDAVSSSDVNKTRFKAVIEKLELFANQDYQSQINDAAVKLEKRKEMLRNLLGRVNDERV